MFLVCPVSVNLIISHLGPDDQGSKFIVIQTDVLSFFILVLLARKQGDTPFLVQRSNIFYSSHKDLTIVLLFCALSGRQFELKKKFVNPVCDVLNAAANRKTPAWLTVKYPTNTPKENLDILLYCCFLTHFFPCTKANVALFCSETSETLHLLPLSDHLGCPVQEGTDYCSRVLCQSLLFG